MIVGTQRFCNSNNQKAESRGYDWQSEDSGRPLQHAIDGDGGYGVRQLLRNVNTDGQEQPGRAENQILRTEHQIRCTNVVLASNRIMTVSNCCCPGCAHAQPRRSMSDLCELCRSSSVLGLPGIFSFNQRTNDRLEEILLSPSQVSPGPQRSKPRSPVAQMDLEALHSLHSTTSKHSQDHAKDIMENSSCFVSGNVSSGRAWQNGHPMVGPVFKKATKECPTIPNERAAVIYLLHPSSILNS